MISERYLHDKLALPAFPLYDPKVSLNLSLSEATAKLEYTACLLSPWKSSISILSW